VLFQEAVQGRPSFAICSPNYEKDLEVLLSVLFVKANFLIFFDFFFERFVTEVWVFFVIFFGFFVNK